MTVIGVNGGTGLYEMEGLENVERVDLSTPYGAPSDAYRVGELAGRRMVFLARHGTGHRILPHELNFRANIWGMKKLGVEQILSVSAVGSMKESIAPGHIVLVDQFIDRTKARPSSFFGNGVVAHVQFADPVCPGARALMGKVAKTTAVTVHEGGTYVCIEGPQFSTRAESHLFRSWGVSVIGMTNLPEARLAREAEIHYMTLALATDYDCWHEEEEAVSVEAVMKVLRDNAEKAKLLIRTYAAAAPDHVECSLCNNAVRVGLMTSPELIPLERRRDLAPILDPILNKA